MRILVVHNRYRSAQPSGENAAVDDAVEQLRSAGVTVHTAMITSDGIAGRTPLGLVGTAARVSWSPAGARWIAAAIETSRPDVIHVHNTFPLLSSSVLWSARKQRVPVVYTLHNFRWLCANGLLLRNGRPCTDCVGHSGVAGVVHRCYRHSAAATTPIVAANMVHRGLRTARLCVDRFIAPSMFLKDMYLEAGWPASRITVSRNVCPDPGLRAGPRDGIVCISRLTAEKGVRDLIEAWIRYLSDQDTTLTIVGDGPERPSLERLARGCRNVRFTGMAPGATVADHLASSIALVVPSRCYEVSPRVAAEAYAAGTPVIAPQLGGLAELVVDGRTGLSTTPGSARSMARAIAQMIASPGLARSLGAGARAFFEAELSPATTVSSLIGIYDTVVSNRTMRTRSHDGEAGEPVALRTVDGRRRAEPR
jgi:glycosyltransferase involved in cell wall biosynthesis